MKRHQGQRIKTALGDTDITTSDMHLQQCSAEDWATGYMQLLGFHALLPRPDLRLCLHDTASLTETDRHALLQTLETSTPCVSLYFVSETGDEHLIFDAERFQAKVSL